MSEYVTVVSVDLQPKLTTSMNAINNSVHNEHEKKSSFVTVLSINNNQNTTTISTSENPSDGEIVTVYRLPGERLGFGLKFQGGTQQNEKVQRLFIQSCDAESPASRARASWGPLGEGDEVLQIDAEPVTGMTRIECVKCLKDRNVAINLLVKKRDKSLNGSMKNGVDGSAPKKRPLPPPPPMVPPRKIIKKPPTRELPVAPKIIMEIPTPVAAEMYLNTLDDDDINRNDESDETGSTISSQISVISNFSSESDLSMLSATTNANSSEFTKILTKPFQMIEREFNVNSSNVLPSASMSIDNLLMFNDSEPIEIDGSEKVKIDTTKTTLNAYENVDVNGASDEQRQYENIDIKLPPIPRPRSISLPQDACEIDAKTPTKTIESWLNDANTINGNSLSSNKTVPTDDHEQNQMLFECFAAGDDEDDDEKLGPPEMLQNNISEAYFNFSWCGNSTSSLPTIGEAEEEFSSLDGSVMHKVVKG
jgi:PDZ domain